MKKKILSILLAALMLLTLLPVTAMAGSRLNVAAQGSVSLLQALTQFQSGGSVPYLLRKWENGTVTETQETCATYTTINDGSTALGGGNWYVVSANTTITGGITVTGTAHLILCDGAELTAEKGITVASGAALYIYGQSGDSGKLTAAGDVGCAGIGGGDGGASGTVVISGGIISATGGYMAAGIGGGASGGGGTVKIYGGTVTANGDTGCAGIGGGDGGYGAEVTIAGGLWVKDISVSDYGVLMTKSGNWGDTLSEVAKVRIEPASATEPVSYVYRNWDDAANSPIERDRTCADYATVTATTTTLKNLRWYVVATDTTISSRITVEGTAYLILCDGVELKAQKGITVASGTTLHIYGQSGDSGTLTATANGEVNSAGIGGGNGVSGGTVVISGGIIEAMGNYTAAGIGGGAGGNGGTVNIYGGTVSAAGGGTNGAGIGGGAGGSGGTVNIYGGSVTAMGSDVSIGGYNTVATAAEVRIVDSLTVKDISDGEPGTKIDLSGTWGDTLKDYTSVKIAMEVAVCEHVMQGTNSLTASGKTLRLTATDTTYSAGVLNEAKLEGLEDFQSTTKDTVSTIAYYRNGVETDSPVDAGNYVAKAVVRAVNGETYTLQTEFTIRKVVITAYIGFNPNANVVKSRDYEKGNTIIQVSFSSAPQGQYLFGMNAYTGWTNKTWQEFNQYVNKSLETLDKDENSGKYIAGTYDLGSDEPGEYDIVITWALPEEAADNYELAIEAKGCIVGEQSAPRAAEGYEIDRNMILTVKEGYEVSADPAFSVTIPTGEKLVEGNTYYIRKVQTNCYEASQPTKFTAKVTSGLGSIYALLAAAVNTVITVRSITRAVKLMIGVPTVLAILSRLVFFRRVF